MGIKFKGFGITIDGKDHIFGLDEDQAETRFESLYSEIIASEPMPRQKREESVIQLFDADINFKIEEPSRFSKEIDKIITDYAQVFIDKNRDLVIMEDSIESINQGLEWKLSFVIGSLLLITIFELTDRLKEFCRYYVSSIEIGDSKILIKPVSYSLVEHQGSS